MWEYKIVRLTENEYKEINRIKQECGDEFKQKYPDWDEKQQQMSEMEKQLFINEEFVEPMNERIESFHPGITTIKNERYQFNPLLHLEATLNEFGKLGWELDRMRLSKPFSFTDGILIFRRKKSE